MNGRIRLKRVLPEQGIAIDLTGNGVPELVIVDGRRERLDLVADFFHAANPRSELRQFAGVLRCRDAATQGDDAGIDRDIDVVVNGVEDVLPDIPRHLVSNVLVASAAATVR